MGVCPSHVVQRRKRSQSHIKARPSISILPCHNVRASQVRDSSLRTAWRPCFLLSMFDRRQTSQQRLVRQRFTTRSPLSVAYENVFSLRLETASLVFAI